MSEDGTGFQDVSEEEGGAEPASPAAAPAAAAAGPAATAFAPVPSVEGVDDWVTDLLDRLASGSKLTSADSARVPYATQLQQQFFTASQQAKAEVSAARLARTAAQGQQEILQQLAAVKRQSVDDLAAVRKELEEVKRGKEEDTEPAHREYVPRSKENPFGGPQAPGHHVQPMPPQVKSRKLNAGKRGSGSLGGRSKQQAICTVCKIYKTSFACSKCTDGGAPTPLW